MSNLVYFPGVRDARLAGFKLAFDLDERDIGEPLGEDCRDVKRRHRIARKQSGCLRNIKL